jgi:hypothetical protein
MANTKYQVNGRLDDLEKAVGRLEFDLKQIVLKPGPAGESVQGPKGERGLAGKDAVCKCVNGRDGRDAVGIQGPAGRPGKDCVCRTEIAEARLAAVEQKIESLLHKNDELVFANGCLTTLVTGMLDMNMKGGLYIDFLRARSAARANNSQQYYADLRARAIEKQANNAAATERIVNMLAELDRRLLQ